MSLYQSLEANLYPILEASSLSQFMLNNQWSWPWAETLHFCGMCLLVGSLLAMDLRLMGFFRHQISLHAVHALTPYGLAGFLINLLTGISFFVTRPASYANNVSFQLKMLFMLLAGINFLIFWFVIRKQLATVADDGMPSGFAKAVGFSSLLMWFLVIWGGRLLPVYGVG